MRMTFDPAGPHETDKSGRGQVDRALSASSAFNGLHKTDYN
jgi:hypothetical protein